LLYGVAEDDFVHGGQGIGKIENAFQLLANVVGVEDRVLGGLTDAGAVGQNIGQGANEHAEISAEGTHFADGGRPHAFKSQLAACFFDQNGNGPKRLQDLLHGHRAGAGAASAMRGAERLVQVEVHDVHAELAGARDAGESVHVGAIHVEERAFGVQYVGD